ncbi:MULTISPECIES: hypothetical protein [Methylobacteriaceae]|jgi:hypothetical protein|uniref:Uncharacterized protein n=1 Tax=Methylobacterium gregans TaxID=374424 RepID=A0AA37MCU8_9HYPH|nr:hypothetical protein [Methylobacterium gregans]MDQ0522325.1 hypothetical protein [Methylobacterium gregans]GJD81467.1 hypothetical protein NBEOAGPD_4716 [Methylobacterium gregans]GLS55068.1 hypothetical protein GCM10007886_32520 [Methylobacterium gregans]
MRTVRLALMLVLAAMALAAQKVWDGTRWIARAMSGMPTPPATDVEDVMDAAQARASAPVTPSQPAAESVTPSAAPAPAPARIVELDPVLARGKLALRFVDCTFSLEPEENVLAECDDVLKAWLLSLNAAEMMAIHRAGAHRTAAHLVGKRLIEGLPEIATDAEYRHVMGKAARMTPRMRAEIREWNATLDAAIEEMVEDPAYELRAGI